MSRAARTTCCNQIRRYRRKRALRVRDLARLIGVGTWSHVSEWENGHRLPSLGNALKLSVALRCPLEILFNDLFRSHGRTISDRKERFNIGTKH